MSDASSSSPMTFRDVSLQAGSTTVPSLNCGKAVHNGDNGWRLTKNAACKKLQLWAHPTANLLLPATHKPPLFRLPLAHPQVRELAALRRYPMDRKPLRCPAKSFFLLDSGHRCGLKRAQWQNNAFLLSPTSITPSPLPRAVPFGGGEGPKSARVLNRVKMEEFQWNITLIAPVG